jgi:hypothetical protein
MDLTAKIIQFAEKRTKPRINCNYPAVVRGLDARGKKYEESARVINLSRGGAYALIKRPMEAGDVLSVQIAFPTGSLQWGTPKLATNAVVKRSELKGGELCGIAIEFQGFRFM